MRTRSLEAFYEKHSDEEGCHFERIRPERRLSTHPDLHAMILLSHLARDRKTEPNNIGIISAASHDMIEFSVTPQMIAAACNEEDLLDLMRCGVCLRHGGGSFYKFT